MWSFTNSFFWTENIYFENNNLTLGKDKLIILRLIFEKGTISNYLKDTYVTAINSSFINDRASGFEKYDLNQLYLIIFRDFSFFLCKLCFPFKN